MSVETNSHNYTNMNNTFSQFSLSPARIPPKQKEEQMENSSPNPSFSICDIRIQKQISRSFGKTESALFRHLPEYLEGRTPKEKHPFLFQNKFRPRQIRNARSVFLSGLPRLCEAVAERFIPHQDCFKKGSNFVQ